MSFLTAADGQLACDLWPTQMVTEIRKLQGTNLLRSWEKFPSSLRGMVPWSDVYKDDECKDRSRNRILIYKVLIKEEEDSIFPVALRLHGVLRQFRVERFGNWTGKDEDILRAVQHITLASGGHNKAWDGMKNSMNLASEYVSRRLRVPKQEMSAVKEMYLQRRVFHKCDSPRNSKEPVLSATDDPEGKFVHLQDHWGVSHPLHVGEQSQPGIITPVDSVLLTEGDFVEVSAELDFILNRDRNGRTVLKSFLACTYMVRLINAEEVQKLHLDDKNSKQKGLSTPPLSEPAPKKYHTALDWDK